MKRIILGFFILLLTSCSNDTELEQNNLTTQSKPSCLIEDMKRKIIILCFEGDLNHVEQKCTRQNKQTKDKKNILKVTFSETKGCPKDRGYFGHCILDKGKYIPYSYVEPSLNMSEKNKRDMVNIYKDDCFSFKGTWVH